MSPAAASASTTSAVRTWAVVCLACLALVCASIALHRSLSRVARRHEAPPPVLGATSTAFSATERGGRPITWADLRGKVVVCASLYTVCPHGCAAVVTEMRKLLAEHGTRRDFQLVSIALAPERDSAASLRGYAEALGLKPGDPWWFLTGDRGQIWSFLTDDLKLAPPRAIPEEQRLNPLDFYEHDLRIVLLDRSGRVRGHYEVSHPQPEIASLLRDRLETDIRRLLDDPAL